LTYINTPVFFKEMIVFGAFRVSATVISVMLPPMAIFFPLFTLLEDSGYLPRIAYNMDGAFQRCGACGKQALTMCMGFGCNAVGVVGCRIIDSPRERLLAMITNSFVPCNGRFPAIITLIGIFFVGPFIGFQRSLIIAVILSLFVVFSIFVSLLVTRILSSSFLKGISSSFILELPSYRRPDFLNVVVRSFFDRTLFVLGRAISVAFPSGIVLWLFSNVYINGNSIIDTLTGMLDPVGNAMGFDGAVLLAFVLGSAANETVLPIIIMIYNNGSNLLEAGDIYSIKEVLINNGWTWTTAVSTVIFSLIHWPCATTVLSVKKESGSLKWTLISFAIPTLCGAIFCILFTAFTKILIKS